MKWSRRPKAAALILLAAALLLISGCSNAIDAGTGAAGPAPAATVKPKGKLTFALISHGTAGDPFWTIVKNGAEQAGRDLGVRVQYQSSGDPQTQSQYIDAATNQHVDGLIVSMANPDALKSSITNAEKAGIPVITINAGEDVSAKFGALLHVGQNETIAGQAAGTRLKSLGLHHVVCVIHEAGNTSLDQRCNGAASTFGGKMDRLQVDVNDLNGAQSTIRSKLQEDKSIDGVLTLNPAVATAAVAAKGSSKATLATFDVSADVIRDVQQGKLAFAVDQQPYLQGYLPVNFLYLYATNGDVTGGGKPVLTGPGFITKQNAAQIAKYAARGTR
ncbi:MAG TPA: sugar ABC transporter substrate-binding protein [Streptosporangiaceae bacterium]|jgi:simple sugar transport system substrate-binding protein